MAPPLPRNCGQPLFLLLLLSSLHHLCTWRAVAKEAAVIERSGDHDSPLNRTGFPRGFVFGTASSAYQYEGGAREGGKGPSIWDTFTHEHPEKIKNGSNGDMAVDSYHRYKEDVSIMKNMHMDAYRFSISWSRILPNGTLSGGVNKEGIIYYNNLINHLISNGIQPFVTLFHFDTPQALDDLYGGFLNIKIVDDFRDYADICFREFGDRVKHWITINEPWTFSNLAYANGMLAPGRCSYWVNHTCTGGDSGSEPYIVSHNQLLAHAAVVKLYRNKYQVSQKGVIGITLLVNWYIPFSKSKADVDAANRAIDFLYGWFMDPLTGGDYPFIMRALVGERLPIFTSSQSKMVKGSYDFIGLNYYTSNYAANIPFHRNSRPNYNTDSLVKSTGEKNGKLIGRKAASPWLLVYPPGLRKSLLYTKSKYNNPVIYITENGVDELNNGSLTLEQALQDDDRIDYYHGHLLYLQKSIREGVDVRGYFAWSLLDNFEWADGFTVRFGINYVDYKNGLKRYPKKSALWFRNFLKR